ncbi:MAG: hypothetical protein KGD58_02520 [Candidatus Lokiarchaeota archaeon]|nr:hypothetical protein [Candidatus Lokiarchaeota archaeon]
MNVGDEWTYMTKRQGISQGTEGINVTHVPSPPELVRGDIYVNGTATFFNQTLDNEFLFNETMITALMVNYSTKTRSYAGVPCECVYIPTERGGYWMIDTTTGIVVEIYSVNLLFFIEEFIKVHTWVISWSVTDIPEDPREPSVGGTEAVPGYDILFTIGIIAVISTLITIRLKKK